MKIYKIKKNIIKCHHKAYIQNPQTINNRITILINTRFLNIITLTTKCTQSEMVIIKNK